MMKLLPVAIFLTTLACQSTGSLGKRPHKSQNPDKSPGPIVVPASVDDATKGNESSTGSILPSDPDMGAISGGTPVDSKNEEPATAIYLGESDPTQNKNLPYGMPTLTSSADNWIISRPQYVLSWNKKTRNLNWVAWVLSREDFEGQGRQGNFSVDPDLDRYIAGSDISSVTTTDYTGSCFDRGHQVASSDRQASDQDNVATYYTTNIIPQASFLNQVIWKKLEASIENWLIDAKYKNLWVVAGPIYGPTIGHMGPAENIAVPSANFKAVFTWDELSKDKPYLVKAVIMPNVLSNGTSPLSDHSRLCAEQGNGGRFRIGTDDKTKKAINEKGISEEVDDYLATIPAIEAAAKIKFPELVKP